MITPDEPYRGIPTPRTSPDQGLRPIADQEAALLDGLTTAVCVVSPAWTLLRCNRAAEDAFGVRSSHIAGRPLRDIFPWLASMRETELYRSTLADGRPRFARIELPDGAGMCDLGIGRGRGGTLVLECRPIPDMERELSQRIRESESLRSLAHRMAEDQDIASLLRTLADTAQEQCGAEAAFVVEVKGNDAELVATSGALADIVGCRIPYAGSLTERVKASGSVVSEPAYSERHHHLQALIPSYPLGPVAMAPLMAHGQQLGMLGVGRGADAEPFTPSQVQRLGAIADYAALVLWKAQMLEQAQSANEAKASFLATMSHELRTPITALTGYGELLADQILGPLAHDQLDLVERMRSVTHHLSVLIEDMLAFASLEAGREQVRLHAVHGRDVVNAAVAVIEPMARQKGLTLRTELDDDSHKLRTDEDKLRQILVNLAGNAVKFTEQGEIVIRMYVRGDHAVFQVCDTGMGIAEQDQGRLFQPFTQLDGGLTRRHGGTGLGLYLSRRFAALLGGTIEVQSELGKGSTFSVLLPA